LLNSSWVESESYCHPYAMASLLLLVSVLESGHRRIDKDHLSKKLYGELVTDINRINDEFK
jgi:hypothetical protein